jgi:hypothetical protein
MGEKKAVFNAEATRSCRENSLPLSVVRVFTQYASSLRKVINAINASPPTCAVLNATWTMIEYQKTRSIIVTRACFCPAPITRSASQPPKRARSSAMRVAFLLRPGQGWCRVVHGRCCVFSRLLATQCFMQAAARAFVTRKRAGRFAQLKPGWHLALRWSLMCSGL